MDSVQHLSDETNSSQISFAVTVLLAGPTPTISRAGATYLSDETNSSQVSFAVTVW